MPLLGQVTLNEGNFYAPNETLTDHDQLPQFLPRTQWVSSHASSQSEKAKLKTDIDWLDERQISQLHRAISNPLEGVYRHLKPMQPFDNNRENYHDTPWLSHLAIVHTLLHRTLHSSDSNVSTAEMRALLRIVSYGMHQTTAFLPPYRVDGVPTNKKTSRARPDKFAEEWNATFDLSMKKGCFIGGENVGGRRYCEERLWCRRFVVVPMIYDPSQWGMTLFDRLCGELYIFDCGSDDCKDERVRACVDCWIVFWNNLGMANTFKYFVPDVMKQPGVKDSGLLCAIWLMNTLRNRVGKQVSTEDEHVRRLDIDVCEPQNRPSCFHGNLHLRDWPPHGCSTYRSALMGVRRILRIMLCNELSLHTHQVMTKAYVNPRNPQGNPLPSAWARLSAVKAALAENGGRHLPASQFWTGNGGPCFALPIKMDVEPYDAAQTRRHHARFDDGQVILETDTQNLVNQNWNFAWPKNPVHTPNNPIRRPIPAIDLCAKQIEFMKNSRFERGYHVLLLNRLAPEGLRDLEQVVSITLNEFGWVRDQYGEERVKINLEVAMDDDLPVQETVIIPLDEFEELRDSAAGDSEAETTQIRISGR